MNTYLKAKFIQARNIGQFFKRLKVLCLGLLLVIVPATAGANISFPSTPLFLRLINVPPLVMLTMSRDHQYFFKAYNDYNDLDGDGAVDTTYTHSFDYYGYFDPDKCYSYNTSTERFVPQAFTANKYCDSSAAEWSGNFLNWASMTRMDIVRKILYGGKRSTDSNSLTVLERAFLPHDAHSFAKFYNGTDISRLTPFTGNFSDLDTQDHGITICNTTNGSGFSQTDTSPPHIRVAQGDYALWASNERYQCTWSNEDGNRTNANNTAQSGLNSHSSDPDITLDGLGQKNYKARVEVCNNSSLIAADTQNNENCRQYPDGNFKPAGLLQAFSEDDDFEFGLMTGSFNRNKSGGILRKNVESMDNEVNIDTDGTFKTPPTTGAIVSFLDALRLYGYEYDPGFYNNNDNCGFLQDTYNEGNCRSWGNPISEIFLETLHYFAGDSATAAFSDNDTSLLPGLTNATFTDPLSSDNECATMSALVFNASTAGFDGDQTTTSINGNSINATSLTNTVGDGEGITGNSFFVGENGSNNDEFCTAKTVSAFGDVRGFCPESPTEEGSYHIAGLAHYGFTNDLRSGLTGDQVVRTYAVALATNVPEIMVPVNANTNVTILPAYRLTAGGKSGAGQLVDFKVVQPHTQVSPGVFTGRFYVNWEDSVAGGDFDQDMWGTIEYELDTRGAAPTIEVRTDLIQESTFSHQFFGFIINGTTQDGFHAFSGIEDGQFVDPLNDPLQGGAAGTIPDCSASAALSTSSNPAIDGTSPTGGDNDCDVGDPPAAHIFTVDTAGTGASLLQDPLFYAAKWGNFEDSDDDNQPLLASEWDTEDENGNPGPDGIPDNFFFVTNPSVLEDRLESTLSEIKAVASASANSVSVNSTVLRTDTRLYQATFSSFDWSGELSAFSLDSGGNVVTPEVWTASFPTAGARNILTTVDKSGTPTPISFDSTDVDVNTAVGNGQPAVGSLIVDYIRGDQTLEQQNGGTFRNRTTLLGDVVNASPVSISNQDFAYDALPGSEPEGSTYSSYLSSKTSLYTGANGELFNIVAVAANDGMVHIFQDTENTSPSTAGREVFAYVPSQVHSELFNLADPNYAHQFYVDATPHSADAFVNRGGTDQWITMLVGSLGSGGRALYALDISDPFNMGPNDVMWEFDSSDNNELGFVLNSPTVVKLNNGRWGVVVANGYNSASQDAQLFILDAEDGSVIRVINTDPNDTVTAPNGLARAFLLDEDADRIADAVYAGDLQGNLWEFDISSSNPGQWDVAYSQGNEPLPLYTALDDNGTPNDLSDDTPQPITTRPTVVNHPDGGFLVLFGTGKYIEPDDSILTATPQVQTFYGVRDNGAPVGSGRTILDQQTIQAELDVLDGGGNVVNTARVVSNNAVDYVNKQGWYLDLISPVSGIEGERIVADPVVRFGRVVFTTFIPKGGCEQGGSSFLMELDAVSGARLEDSVFDTNDDGVIDQADLVNFNGNDVPASGVQLEGTLGSVVFVTDNTGGSEVKLTSSITGQIQSTQNAPPGGFVGRQSWRQLR